MKEFNKSARFFNKIENRKAGEIERKLTIQKQLSVSIRTEMQDTPAYNRKNTNMLTEIPEYYLLSIIHSFLSINSLFTLNLNYVEIIFSKHNIGLIILWIHKQTVSSIYIY